MRVISIIAPLLGMSGVILGAFGAHGLKTLVSPEALEVWKTAVSYQMYHAPVLLMLAWFGSTRPNRWLKMAGILFVIGTLIFSGSLYALVWFDLPILGAVTPLGGVCLILAWISLFLFALQDKGQH